MHADGAIGDQFGRDRNDADFTGLDEVVAWRFARRKLLAHAPAQHHDGDRWNCESAKQVVHVGILVAHKAPAIESFDYLIRSMAVRSVPS
jgi:hypothetical protein